MPKPVSVRRCPLARCEAAVLADLSLGDDLRYLVSFLCREARRRTMRRDGADPSSTRRRCR